MRLPHFYFIEAFLVKLRSRATAPKRNVQKPVYDQNSFIRCNTLALSFAVQCSDSKKHTGSGYRTVSDNRKGDWTG